MARRTINPDDIMNTAARKISQSSPARVPPPAKPRTNALNQRVVIKPNGQPAPIPFKGQKPPTWFMRLSSLQSRFGAATFLLMGGMLLVYGATVYNQQKWSQEYLKLKDLQRHERQLITTNELLKNQMATEAETPDTGLVPPNPAEAVVLQSASENAASLPQVKPAPKIEVPSGY